MEDALRVIKVENLTVSIYRHEQPTNPREYDTLGTMAYWSNKYALGDERHTDNPDAFYAELLREGVFILPLYIYDHSGVTMSTSGFSCPWDSGQTGWIYVKKETVRKEYRVKRISPQLRERVMSVLEQEVKTFNQWLAGDIYGYEVKGPNGEHVDSCWGFFGIAHCDKEARAIAQWHIRHRHWKRLKTEGVQTDLAVTA
jgi:hypothetical protein